MARAETLTGRTVAILGMARSGIAAARLCLREGAKPICFDLERRDGHEAEIRELETAGVECLFGPHPIDRLASCQMVVKSPGVPREIDFLKEARETGIPVISEVELAWRHARGPVLAVTGTNGKSTTASWVADMLARSDRNYELGGNIGRPLCEAVMSAAEGAILVAEISSFQLEEIDSFQPRGAALLNLSPDHLDRHRGLDDYREAKMQIFRNQTEEDHAVLGPQEDLAEEVARRFRSRLLRFRLVDRGEEGAFAENGRIGLRHGNRVRRLGSVGDLSLPGPHNLANALAALALLAPFDLPDDPLGESLRRFPGLAHRLERIAEIGGVLYVNDSKATNTDSLGIALDAFASPLILLAGGRGKGQSFGLLRERVTSRCRMVILFGEDASAIRSAWGESCEVVEDLESATSLAAASAKPGEIVLLSPACASFDQFKDYEERGDRFRAIVRRMKDSRGQS